ncbi:MAG: sigma 54-interacting transcriptional regulator [bacterium]
METQGQQKSPGSTHQRSNKPTTGLQDREIFWLRSILESLPVGVITLDRDWRITSFNRAASEITGYTAKEVLGWRCYELFKSPVCQRDCPIERALSCSVSVYDREVTFLNRNHRRVTVLVNATPLRDAEGRVIGGLETLRDISALEWMRQELALNYDYSHIVGQSEAMQQVYRRMEQVSRTDTTVLILGESGTGKELVARAIHHNSERKDHPFIAVNCSALPESILESELFGHVRGAFTGAIRDKVGRFEMANGGTLFLDEVGELSPSVQIKLLRVLQEREFQRVGDIRTMRVDIRLIAATNKNLRAQMEAGLFREDLYYRLHVFPIELPPLRARLEDLPMLVNHFIEKFNHQMGRRVRGLSGEAMDAMYSYSWPGNIRELENAIEHAFVHSKGVIIQLEDLPKHVLEGPTKQGAPTPTNRETAVESFERDLILRHLKEASWRRALAAKRLGISPVTLWRKMKKYGITPFPS